MIFVHCLASRMLAWKDTMVVRAACISGSTACQMKSVYLYCTSRVSRSGWLRGGLLLLHGTLQLEDLWVCNQPIIARPACTLSIIFISLDSPTQEYSLVG